MDFFCDLAAASSSTVLACSFAPIPFLGPLACHTDSEDVASTDVECVFQHAAPNFASQHTFPRWSHPDCKAVVSSDVEYVCELAAPKSASQHAFPRSSHPVHPSYFSVVAQRCGEEVRECLDSSKQRLDGCHSGPAPLLMHLTKLHSDSCSPSVATWFSTWVAVAAGSSTPGCQSLHWAPVAVESSNH